ncbi:hypothetical protein NDU88_005879 [Pleurodeles waltl]|uniref:Uncharacterized protein n=1 Tax=Pleurodeles waltl TaxID=8319 RepID=A0AAV7WZW4_PLEWA|nr:hypothetical protein NDU88_005879 [Pleurodeles waltl]
MMEGLQDSGVPFKVSLLSQTIVRRAARDPAGLWHTSPEDFRLQRGGGCGSHGLPSDRAHLLGHWIMLRSHPAVWYVRAVALPWDCELDMS